MRPLFSSPLSWWQVGQAGPFDFRALMKVPLRMLVMSGCSSSPLFCTSSSRPRAARERKFGLRRRAVAPTVRMCAFQGDLTDAERWLPPCPRLVAVVMGRELLPKVDSRPVVHDFGERFPTTSEGGRSRHRADAPASSRRSSPPPQSSGGALSARAPPRRRGHRDSSDKAHDRHVDSARFFRLFSIVGAAAALVGCSSAGEDDVATSDESGAGALSRPVATRALDAASVVTTRVPVLEEPDLQADVVGPAHLPRSPARTCERGPR